jgi:hypothetical protein
VFGAPRIIIGLLANVLPWSWKRFVYRTVLRYVIHDSAYVGFSLVPVKHLSMGANCRIGHLNVIRGCDSLILQTPSTIGHLNVITAVPSKLEYDGHRPTDHGTILLVHERASIGNFRALRSHGEGRDWLCCIR